MLKQKTQKWNVSIYQDLNTHAESNDELEHDHIPSSYVLEKSVSWN